MAYIRKKVFTIYFFSIKQQITDYTLVSYSTFISSRFWLPKSNCSAVLLFLLVASEDYFWKPM